MKTMLKEYAENSISIRIELKNKFAYTGKIEELSDESLIFKDRADDKIIISYDMITLVSPVKQGGNSE